MVGEGGIWIYENVALLSITDCILVFHNEMSLKITLVLFTKLSNKFYNRVHSCYYELRQNMLSSMCDVDTTENRTLCCGRLCFA